MEARRGATSPLLPASAVQHATGAILPESLVFDAFHSYARGAVIDAVWARLMTRSQAKELDWEIMFAVPALTLVKAALESNDRHEIPIARRSHVKLTLANCPPSLRPTLQRWVALAPRIKAHKRDIKALRLYLAGKGQDSTPPELRQLASEINGLAIEITQRRTYQSRLQSTLESAASHVEADSYESEDEAETAAASNAAPSRPATPPAAAATTQRAEPPAPSAPPWPMAPPSAPPLAPPATPARAGAGEATAPSAEVTAPIPDSPALRAIREVLYSAVLEDLAADDSGRLHALVRADRARGISGVTALAMLRVAKQMVTPDKRRIYLHEGEPLLRQSCPEELRPLFDLLTTRHDAVNQLTPAESRLLRDQLLGTGHTPALAGSQVLALASLFSVFTARVMGLQQHRQHMEEAFEIFGL